jgi:MFS transporter, OFA family, oxalate/formate antiporter
LALGIAVAGSGLGQSAITLIIKSLIDTVNWRSTLRYLALITFIGVTLCSLFIFRLLPCTTEMSSKRAWELFEDRNFVFLYLSALFTTLGLFMPYTHVITYAQEEGVSSRDATLILSLMGITSAIGRVVLGGLADRLGRLSSLQFTIFAGSISTYCWIFCRRFPEIFVYALIYSFFAGGLISLIPAVCADLFGTEILGIVIGLLYTSTSIGNLLAAPIGGFLFDYYGYYTPSIAVTASVMFIGFFFSLFVSEKNKLIIAKFTPVVSLDGIELTTNTNDSNSNSNNNNNNEEREEQQEIEQKAAIA